MNQLLNCTRSSTKYSPGTFETGSDEHQTQHKRAYLSATSWVTMLPFRVRWLIYQSNRSPLRPLGTSGYMTDYWDIGHSINWCCWCIDASHESCPLPYLYNDQVRSINQEPRCQILWSFKDHSLKRFCVFYKYLPCYKLLDLYQAELEVGVVRSGTIPFQSSASR